MEDSLGKLETLASIIAKAIAVSSKEEHFGAREHIDWMFDHSKKKIAFRGQLLELRECRPSYYSASHVMNLAQTNQKLAVALSDLQDLGYEITSWQLHKDIDDRDEDLLLNNHLDVDKYKQLLNNYPPVVIRTRNEASRVSSLITELEESSDFPQEIDCYLSLLKLLLNDWELHQATGSGEQKTFQTEPPEAIPF